MGTVLKPRGVLIAGNWKMNLGPKETETYFAQVREGLKTLPLTETGALLGTGKLKLCLFPPMLSLSSALQSARDLGVAIGAQNAHWEKSGAFTGEVSGPMLHELGIDTVLVGHSERRQYFGETDESARKRTESLLEQRFRILLCFGETKAERERGETQSVINRQLGAVLHNPKLGASLQLGKQLMLAYEPVWAIGTGLTATPAQAEEAHRMVRLFLSSRCGETAAESTVVLYGGSVTPEICLSLLQCPNIDGTLVGGASVKSASFLSLVKAAVQVLASD